MPSSLIDALARHCVTARDRFDAGTCLRCWTCLRPCPTRVPGGAAARPRHGGSDCAGRGAGRGEVAGGDRTAGGRGRPSALLCLGASRSRRTGRLAVDGKTVRAAKNAAEPAPDLIAAVGHTETVRAHGHTETRTLKILIASSEVVFPGRRQFAQITRTCLRHKGTDPVTSTEYVVTDPGPATPPPPNSPRSCAGTEAFEAGLPPEEWTRVGIDHAAGASVADACWCLC